MYAVDLVGNQGAPVNATFLVDTTPPVFTSLSFPHATNHTTVNVTFTVDDGLAGWVASQGVMPAVRVMS